MTYAHLTDKQKRILHILRNPYGFSDKTIKEVRLAAADEIEKLQGDYENMRDWALENGLDINTYFGPVEHKPPEAADVQ